MTKSDQINELAAALAKAQSEMKGAVKDSANPFFKSKYADLASVWDAWKPVGPKNGLAIVQTASAEGPRVTVTTMLCHVSGQWIQGALTATAKEESGQAIGSIITYLRRYGLAAIVGIAPEDDDGEAAEARHKQPTARVAPPPDKTQQAAETIVAQVEGKVPKPKHVVDLFDRILRQQSPKGPDGTHTKDQKSYAAKLMGDAAAMFAFGKKPSQEWTVENCATLTKHFFGDTPDEQKDIPF